jgi:protein involved in polysaccharide export with SLBB domain
MRPLNKASRRKWWVFLVSGLLVLPLAGCAGSVSPSVSIQQMASEPLNEQVLGVGDVVDISFLYNPELNSNLRVRPDGNISLKIVGDVKVEGKTREELEKELVKLYAPELRNPKVTVTVTSLRNNKVYVSGEVVKPGTIDMPGRITLFEAINEAGGFKPDTADTSKVMIIRTRNGQQYSAVVNFKEIMEGKKAEPIYLRPSDVVFVDCTTIAKANRWVDQHINKMIPRVPVSLSAMP